MTDSNVGKTTNGQRRALPLWAGGAILALAAIVVVLLGLLAVSIMERRWEAQRPGLVVTPLADWEPDNAVWGRNYPREYESYRRTRIDDTKTRFGGASHTRSFSSPATVSARSTGKPGDTITRWRT